MEPSLVFAADKRHYVVLASETYSHYQSIIELWFHYCGASDVSLDHELVQLCFSVPQ